MVVKNSKQKINFFGVYKDILPYKHHVIERGKWFLGIFKSLKNEDWNFRKKAKLNFIETLIWLFKKIFLII